MLENPPDDLSQEAYLLWMLRQMVDSAAKKRADTLAKDLVAERLQESKEYQKKLDQRRRWLLKLVKNWSETASGAGFYMVSVGMALMIGAIVAVNIPHAVVCGEVDPICPFRVKGETLTLEELR